ncbi:transmembrane signal receptor [Lithospermum erythrorhizon]|uniref:Transmembrane signal receptor n=1 Tax=Lithospermum erythrorhizon TaxID=34254 RepID=A0AAV3Q398_LITER
MVLGRFWICLKVLNQLVASGCLRIKYSVDGTILSFKERLVAKGFIQRESIDYFDTYAPVVRTTSIRMLFALASIYHLYVHQMGVKTTFLNGDLTKEVYMEQPEGFILLGNENKVCRLVKLLYGLNQASKKWHKKFDDVILANGLKHNGVDKCVYSKTCNEYKVILCLYVDDMLIFSNYMEGIVETKKYISSVFEMKDQGEVNTILGIKVKRDDKGFTLSQTHYIDKMVDKFEHLDIKEALTPYDHSKILEENKGRVAAQLEYASAIGSLIYAAYCTKIDVAFVVCKLSRFTTVLEGYCDASWLTQNVDSKAISGWLFTLGGDVVSWASKKQIVIAHLTMEFELISIATAGKEAEWLRDLLMHIALWPQPMGPVSLFCDSQAAIARAYSEVYNGKSRHISMRYAYIREVIGNGVMTMTYVKIGDYLADPLTKPLSREMVKRTAT